MAAFVEEPPFLRVGFEPLAVVGEISELEFGHAPLEAFADLSAHLAESRPAQVALRQGPLEECQPIHGVLFRFRRIPSRTSVIPENPRALGAPVGRITARLPRAIALTMRAARVGPKLDSRRGSRRCKLPIILDQLSSAENAMEPVADAREFATFVCTHNIENFADRLSTEIDPARRMVLMRLLVEEADKLGVGLEQLGLSEAFIARGQGLIAKQRALIERLENCGRDTRSANDILSTLLKVHNLFKDYRHVLLCELKRL